VISYHKRAHRSCIVYIFVTTIRMTDGVVIMIHDLSKNPVCVDENLIRSQCVVAVVKRLKILATCREIWYAVSLVTDRPEEWTYPPPLIIWFFAHASTCGSMFHSG
jgi:hypothetical protein